MRSNKKNGAVRMSDTVLSGLIVLATMATIGCGSPKPKPPERAAVSAPTTKEGSDLVRMGVEEPFSEAQLSVIGLRHFLMYSRFLSQSMALPHACDAGSGECASGDSGGLPSE